MYHPEKTYKHFLRDKLNTFGQIALTNRLFTVLNDLQGLGS